MMARGVGKGGGAIIRGRQLIDGETSPAAKSEEKRMFSQAIIRGNTVYHHFVLRLL